MYDSIEDVIERFWLRDQFGARRNYPWVLIIITDGQDSDSKRYKKNSAAIGRYIAQRYNQEASNFIFIIGVGEGKEIDRPALATLADNGGFNAITIEAFPLLEAIFLEIALNVSTTLTRTQINVGNLSWEEVSRVRQLSNVPIDYAFLIDRSGSMSLRRLKTGQIRLFIINCSPALFFVGG